MFDRVLNTPPNTIIENFTLDFSGRHNHQFQRGELTTKQKLSYFCHFS